MILNRKGVVGFPMRLAITFLILSLFVPVAFTMMNDLDERSQVSAAKYEAEKIGDSVKKMYYSGIGSTCTVDVELTNKSCLVIGGEGSDAYTIRIMIDDSEKERTYLQRPSVKLICDPIYLQGNCTLSLTCVAENGIYGVEVSVLD